MSGFPHGSMGPGEPQPLLSDEGSCVLDEVVRPAEVVLQEDLESLRRTYSEEERVEFWNMVKRAYKDFILRCSTQYPQDVVRLIKGKFRLAMLLLAASFKLNGEEQESIIKMFREEEYRILQDFEEFKIFDSLDVDTIVEFIKRREGKVYEAVKKYYERQYNALDTAWGPLMGDLLAAFENRYRARRKKIEEAVVRYVRRYGLIETVSEIEEAVKKVLEAGEFRRSIEEEVRRKVKEEYRVDEMMARLEALETERARLYEALKNLEDSAVLGVKEVSQLVAELERVKAEKEALLNQYAEAVKKLEALETELTRAKAELAAKEAELNQLAEKYEHHAGAVEALRAEAESLRATINALQEEAEKYRRMLEIVKQEKSVIEERLREVEAVLRGEVEGRVVMAEEADAFTESYLRRIAYRSTGRENPIRIYDPREGRAKEFRGWDDHRTYTLHQGQPPISKGVIFVRKRGFIIKRKDIVLDAVVLLHEDALRTKGYDTKPVTLAEVLDVLRSRVEEAEEGGYYHITAIASPTGFTKKAIEFVGSRDFHRNFIAMVLFALVTSLAYYGEIRHESLIQIMAGLVIVFGIFFVLYKHADRLLNKIIIGSHLADTPFTHLMIIGLLMAIASAYFGLSPLVGAYLAGLAISHAKKSSRIMHFFEVLVQLISPFFFVYAGILLDPWGVASKINTSSGFAIVSVLLAGVIGKVAGCGLVARLRGMSIRESIAVGVGMMPRAGVDLVIAVVGLSLGVLTMELYLSALILIYTTSLTTPLLLKKFLT